MCIHQIYNRSIRNSGIGSKTNLTGARVGVADLDTILLYLLAEFTQSVLVEFWVCQTLIACKATTTYALG